MKILWCITVLSMMPIGVIFSQVAINNNGNPPDNSAMLDIESTSKGFLPPRMTSEQRIALNSPATGLLVFQTDDPSGYYYYSGTDWISVSGAGAATSSCVDFDSNAYPIITLGTQVWMAENLRVTHYREGESIPEVTANAAWQALSTGAYSWYDNDQATNAKYGVLYNWYTADDSRGLCPVGWHVPSKAEWEIFINYLGGQFVAGGKMKSMTELWVGTNVNATNSSGFSGLPGGVRGYDGYFLNNGDVGYWWSSTEYHENDTYYYILSLGNPGIGSGDIDKRYGFSIRCVHD